MFRLATLTDLEALIKMRWDFTIEYNQSVPQDQDTWNVFYEECETFLTEAINGETWFIWVAEVEGQIVSHIYVELIQKIPRPGRVTHPFGYVTNVYTLPEYRGKGIGSELNTAVHQWAVENQLDFLMVWPSDTAVEFYKRNGYAPSEEALELHW